jgi:hypothetical protein
MEEIIKKQAIIRGKFFYSQKQFSWLRADRVYGSKRNAVHPRMYCQLADGSVKEYTEMIEEDVLKEDILTKALCEELFDDVIVLGYGSFHHHGEDVC